METKDGLKIAFWSFLGGTLYTVSSIISGLNTKVNELERKLEDSRPSMVYSLDSGLSNFPFNKQEEDLNFDGNGPDAVLETEKGYFIPMFRFSREGDRGVSYLSGEKMKEADLKKYEKELEKIPDYQGIERRLNPDTKEK